MSPTRPSGTRLDADFEGFVSRSSARLLRSAFVLVGNREDAEDLLQNALVRTLRRWETISGPPDAYVFAVLANLARDHRRTIRRRPTIALQAELPEGLVSDPVESALDRDAVIQAALALPEAQREALACRFLLDLSVAETAAALDIPEGTVKSLTSRALARMRHRLVDARVATRGRSSEAGDVD